MAARPLSRPRATIEAELTEARARLLALETELAQSGEAEGSGRVEEEKVINGLTLREYERYGRQMILNQVGLPGQQAFKRASVLVVGAGGLGCPVLQYLASTGIGRITIVDHDRVELSNLNRQVLHTEARVGWWKAESAAAAMRSMSSSIHIQPLTIPFTPSLLSASSDSPYAALFHPPSTSSSSPTTAATKPFDLIFDCTDNPSTRHLINAYSSLYKIPLVSGGAVRTEGTVGVYNLPLPPLSSSALDDSNVGPCYACIFPEPERRAVREDETIEEREKREESEALAGTGSCSDEGVLGVLCGVVGMAMVSEGLKVLLGTAKPTLLLFSPLSSSPYRTIKVRPRKPTCPTCADPRAKFKTDTTSSSSSDEWDALFCERVGVGEGSKEGRVNPKELAMALKNEQRDDEFLVDVRPKVEFDICSLPGSINIPFSTFLRDPSIVLKSSPAPPRSVTFLCRRGNDSFLAARALRRYLKGAEEGVAVTGDSVLKVVDVKGGLTEWSRAIDSDVPIY